MKRQATEWLTPNSPRLAKFQHSEGMLMRFAYDIRCALYQSLQGVYSLIIATCYPYEASKSFGSRSMRV